MSAKDLRKALPLTLDARTRAALAAYARAHGDRSLAAAARRALRADLGLGRDRAADPTTARARPQGRARTTPLRLQLEPALRARLTRAAGDAPFAEGLADRLAARLERLGWRVAASPQSGRA